MLSLKPIQVLIRDTDATGAAIESTRNASFSLLTPDSGFRV
jgi:hypothetical protein